MLMYTTPRKGLEINGPSPVEPQPANSEISVVFRGDGEPKTPQGLLRRLAEIESEGGLEGGDGGGLRLTVNTAILRQSNDELVRAFQDALSQSCVSSS